MKRWFVTLSFLLALAFLFTPVIITWDEVLAEPKKSSEEPVSAPLLPNEKPNSDLYKSYPPKKLVLIYAGEDTDNKGWVDSLKINAENVFYSGWNDMLNVFWLFYLHICDLAIRVIQYSFTLKIIDLMVDSFDPAFNAVKKGLWDPIWFFMAALSIGMCVYYWIGRRKTKLWTTLLNTLIILAFSSFIFANMGTLLKKGGQVSSCISGSLLNGMSGAVTNVNNSNKDEGCTNPTAMKNISDGLWRFLAIYPYQVLQFGSPEKGEELFLEFHGKKTLENKKKLLQENKITVAQAEGMSERSFYLFFIALPTFIFLGFLLFFSIVILVWQFIAMGYAFVSVAVLLLALWPEYGLGHFFKWIWKTMTALFMKVFYTIVLGFYLVAWSLIQSKVADWGLLFSYIISIALLYGIWHAVRELRKKLDLPLPGGDRLPLMEENKLPEKDMVRGLKAGAGVAAGVASGLATPVAQSAPLASFASLKYAYKNARNIGKEDAEDPSFIKEQGSTHKKAIKMAGSIAAGSATGGAGAGAAAGGAAAGGVAGGATAGGTAAGETAEKTVGKGMTSASVTQSQSTVELDLPPSPPKYVDPEYQSWEQQHGSDWRLFQQAKEEVRQEREEQYSRAKHNYESSFFMKRWFMKKPEPSSPQREDYVERYRQLRRKGNKNR